MWVRLFCREQLPKLHCCLQEAGDGALPAAAGMLLRSGSLMMVLPAHCRPAGSATATGTGTGAGAAAGAGAFQATAAGSPCAGAGAGCRAGRGVWTSSSSCSHRGRRQQEGSRAALTLHFKLHLKLLGVLLALSRACRAFCSTAMLRILLSRVLLCAGTVASGLPTQGACCCSYACSAGVALTMRSWPESSQ